MVVVGRRNKSCRPREGLCVVTLDASPQEPAPANALISPGATPCTPLEWALEYARREEAVFPCFPKTKTPFGNSKKPPGPRNLVPHGHKDATTDLAKTEEWWTLQPDANVGMAMGRVSGRVTI